MFFSGALVCLATEESYYILSFDGEQVQKARDNNEVAEDGIESAFDVLGEVKLLNSYL